MNLIGVQCWLRVIHLRIPERIEVAREPHKLDEQHHRPRWSLRGVVSSLSCLQGRPHLMTRLSVRPPVGVAEPTRWSRQDAPQRLKTESICIAPNRRVRSLPRHRRLPGATGKNTPNNALRRGARRSLNFTSHATYRSTESAIRACSIASVRTNRRSCGPYKVHLESSPRSRGSRRACSVFDALPQDCLSEFVSRTRIKDARFMTVRSSDARSARTIAACGRSASSLDEKSSHTVLALFLAACPSESRRLQSEESDDDNEAR